MSEASQSLVTTDHKLPNVGGVQNYKALMGMYANNDDPAYSTNTTTQMNNATRSQSHFPFQSEFQRRNHAKYMSNTRFANLSKENKSGRALLSTRDSMMSSEQRNLHVLNFKDFRGFKRTRNIKERYKIGRVLGEGSFGQVRLAMHRQANVKCAIKVIRKDKFENRKVLEGLMRSELQVLESLSHPNIMRIYELLDDEKHYYIVSEYIRYGQLCQYILQRKETGRPLTEGEVKIVVRQLFYALSYLHDQGIAHRDVKPENIMIENVSRHDELLIKLVDFGFAEYFGSQKKFKGTLGTPLFMAPEMIQRKKYDTKVDVWSATITVYVMLCGKPPFRGKDRETMF